MPCNYTQATVAQQAVKAFGDGGFLLSGACATLAATLCGEEMPLTPRNRRHMALTRKLLEGMGIEDKQVETIIEAHTETVNGLKADRDKYKEQAEKVPDLQRQLEEAKAAGAEPDQWEEKYESEHQAFEDFKTQVEQERAQAEKAQAYRGMLAKAGIDPKRVDAIMKVTDLTGVEMEGGKLKDADKLEEAAKEEWADFVVRTKTQTEPPATPPKGDNVPEGADPDVARRMQERHERMYGKNETKE